MRVRTAARSRARRGGRGSSGPRCAGRSARAVTASPSGNTVASCTRQRPCPCRWRSPRSWRAAHGNCVRQPLANCEPAGQRWIKNWRARAMRHGSSPLIVVWSKDDSRAALDDDAQANDDSSDDHPNSTQRGRWLTLSRLRRCISVLARPGAERRLRRSGTVGGGWLTSES